MDFGPIRAIEGDTITSPYLPRLGVRFSSDFVYLGDLQYLSRETYHVEEFIFLDPSGIGHAKQILLVHFSGFLENKVGEYKDSTQPTVCLDGEDYHHEVHFIDINDYLARNPQSDLAHAADYIRQRSYTLAGDMIYHRFSRLVSDDLRNHFIIAYLETNPEPAMTSAEIEKDGSLAQTLLDHALKSFTIIH
jgi:hypothetical protein